MDDQVEIGINFKTNVDKQAVDDLLEELTGNERKSILENAARSSRYFAESQSYARVRPSLTYNMSKQYGELNQQSLTRLAFGVTKTVSADVGQSVLNLPKIFEEATVAAQRFNQEVRKTAKDLGVTEQVAIQQQKRLQALRRSATQKANVASSAVLNTQMGLRGESIQRSLYKDWDSYSTAKKNQISNELYTASTGVSVLGRNEGVVEQAAARAGFLGTRNDDGSVRGVAFTADQAGGQHGNDLNALRVGYNDKRDGIFAVEAKTLAAFTKVMDLIAAKGRGVSLASSSSGSISFDKMFAGKLEGFLGSVIDPQAGGQISGSIFVGDDVMKAVLKDDLKRKKDTTIAQTRGILSSVNPYVARGESVTQDSDLTNVSAHALNSAKEAYTQLAADAKSTNPEKSQRAKKQLNDYGLSPDESKSTDFNKVTAKNSKIVSATVRRRNVGQVYTDLFDALGGENGLGNDDQMLDPTLYENAARDLSNKWSESQRQLAITIAKKIYGDLVESSKNSSGSFSKDTEAGKILTRLGLADDSGLKPPPSFDQIDGRTTALLGHSTQISDQATLFDIAQKGSLFAQQRDRDSENPIAAIRSRTKAMGETILNQVQNLDSGSADTLRASSAFMAAANPVELVKAVGSLINNGEILDDAVMRRLKLVRDGILETVEIADESLQKEWKQLQSKVVKSGPNQSPLREASARELGAILNTANSFINDIAVEDVSGMSAEVPDADGYEEFAESAKNAVTRTNEVQKGAADNAENVKEFIDNLRTEAIAASRAQQEQEAPQTPSVLPVAKELADNAERATAAADSLISDVYSDLHEKGQDLARAVAYLQDASVPMSTGVTLKRGTRTAKGVTAEQRRSSRDMPSRGEAPPFADEEKGQVIIKASERSGLGDEDLPDWLYRMSDETESEQLGSVIKSLRTMATSLLDVISMLAISLNNSALDMVNLFKAIVAQLTRIAADLKGIQMNADGAVSAAQSALDSSQETAEAVKEAVEPVRQAVEPVQQAVTGDLDEQLKKPYRALMKQFHPDVYRGPRQQDIASHINELKDAGDLAGLQELQNAGDGLIKVINQQRVAMSKLALETTEVAKEVNQASEIIDATPYVPKPDYELGPEHRRTQFNQRNITPGLMQHHGNLREAWNPANVASELRGQFEEKYQAIGKKFTTGRFDDLMRMTVDVPAKIIQEHRKAAESIADATSTALVPVKQELSSISEEVSTALVPLGKSAIAIREETSDALVPLEKAGLAIRAEVSEALVPIEESGLVIRREAIEALEPLEQAGIALRNKVKSIDASDDDHIEGQFREIGTSVRAALPAGQPPAGGQPPKPPTPPTAQPAGPQGGPPVGPLQKYLNIIGKIQQAIQEWKQKLQGLGNFLNQFAGQIGQLRQTLNQAFSQAKQYVSQFAQFAQQGLSRLGDVVDNLGNKFAGFGKKVRNGFESAKESAATLYFLSSTMTQAGSKLSSFGNQQIQKANQFLTQYSGYEMATNRLSVSAGIGRNEDGTVNPERGFNIAQDFVFGMQRGDFETAGGNAIYTDMYNAEQIAQAAYYYQSAAGTGPSGQSLLASESGQEAMAQILGPILNMAAATQTNPEEYIKGVVNIAQQFGYDPASQEDAGVMGNIANVVGQIANVTTLEIPDILETFKYVGPQLNMLAGGGPGAGLGDALMLVEMASRAGIKGSMAGTGIGQIVSTFVDVPEAVAESVAPLLGLGNLKDGAAVAGFEGMFQTEDGKIEGGILGAISKIVESTSGEPQEVAKVLSKIFTQNATRTSSAIAAQIVKASESQEFLDAAAAYNAGDYDKANRLYEEAMAKTSDTVTASVSRLKNAFFQLKVTMFDAVKNPLKEYLNELANILFTLGDALKENPFISKLAVGLTSVISVVATVLGALLTMGGTLFMIQRSFIMAGGSISLFFGILSTVAAGFFAMIPVILIAGIVIAALAGHLQKTGKSFGDFANEIRSKFNEGLGKTIQDFSLKALKAIELVTFGFYEFVNTILMGNDVGSNFLGALLGKVFGPQAAGIILGMLNKVSSSLTSFRTGVGENVDGIVSKFEALKNIPSVFKGLGQAFAQGYVDINDAVAINDLGKAFGIDGLQVIVVEAANQIWMAISEIWAIFNYFKAEFVAVFDSLREETGTSIDTGPFLSFLVLIRSIVVAIVAGFMGALLGATMAVAGLTRRLNGMSEGNSRIQELVKNVTGLTITLEKLGTILGFVFGASIAGRMLMMIQPVGQLAVHFAKIGIVAGQVGVAIGKTIAMFALQAAQFAVNLLLLGLQAAAWAAYIGIQIFAAGVGLASAAVSAILALSKTQEAGAVTASGLAAVFASAQFLILKAVILGIVAIVLIFVAIWFLAIAALIIAAIGILAIIAATDGLRAALDAAIGFVMAFVDGIRNVIDLMSGVYNWAMGFLMASAGARDLGGVLKEIGTALAWLIGLPVAGLLMGIFAFVGVIIKVSQGIASFVSAVRNSAGAMSAFSALGAGLASIFMAVWDAIKALGKGIAAIVVGFIKFGRVGQTTTRFGEALKKVGEALSKVFKALEPVLMIVGFIIGAVIGLAFRLLVVVMEAVINAAMPLIDTIVAIGEQFQFLFDAIGDGRWGDAFLSVVNIIILALLGVVQWFFGQWMFIVDLVIGSFAELVRVAADVAGFFSDSLGEAINGFATEIDNFRADLNEGFRVAFDELRAEITFDVSGDGENGNEGYASIPEIIQSNTTSRNATDSADIPVLVPIDYVLGYDPEKLLPDSTYQVTIQYVDENGNPITDATSLMSFSPDGNYISPVYMLPDSPDTSFNESGTVMKGDDGQFYYVNITDVDDVVGGIPAFSKDNYGLIHTQGEVVEGSGFTENGLAFPSEFDKIMFTISKRRKAQDEAEAAALSENQPMFGGIFADATNWISNLVGDSDSMQSLFGFAGIDVANLRDGDLGTPLNTKQIQAMMDAADASPRAKKILAPYLDDALESSKEYEDLYWQRETLTEEFEAGLISQDDYIHRLIELTKKMNEAAVSAEDLGAQTKHLMEIEEARMNLAKQITEDFAKALTSTFLTYENYILSSVARTNSAILTANEIALGNKDKVDEALGEGGSDFFFRDPYTGALNSRAYTSEEMMMSFGGFGAWDPQEDGPLDNWLLASNDPSAVAWRESMAYQGKDANAVAGAISGDNRWGANVGLRGMAIGDMTTLPQNTLDNFNRSFLDYQDIAGYASTKMANDEAFNLGDYLIDSGQMFMENGIWTDIDSTNIEDAIAWMNDEYDIDLNVNTITDKDFDDIRGLIFDDKGQIIAATGQLMEGLPKVVETAFGKIAVMSDEEFANLDAATKAYLQASGVTIVTATTEQMSRYSETLGEQLPQILTEGIRLSFEDINQDGKVEGYFIDPATGTRQYLSEWSSFKTQIDEYADENGFSAEIRDGTFVDTGTEGLYDALTASGGLLEGITREEFSVLVPGLEEYTKAQEEAAEAARQAQASTTAAVTQGVVDADIALAVETGTYNALGRFFKGDGDTGVTDAVSPDPPPPASGTKGDRQIGGAVDGSDGAPIGGDSGGTGAGGALGGGLGETGGDTAAGGEGAGAGAGGGFGGDQYGGDEDALVVPYDEAFAASVIDSFGAGAISAFVGLDSLVTDYMGLNFGGQNPAGESVDAVNPGNVPLVTDWDKYNTEIARRKKAEVEARLRAAYESNALVDAPPMVWPDTPTGPVVPTAPTPEPEETIPPKVATPIPDPPPRRLPGEADKPANPEDEGIASRRNALLENFANFEVFRGSYDAYTSLPDVGRELAEIASAIQSRLMELTANGGILDDWFAQGDVSQGMVAHYDGPGDPIYQIMNSWLKGQSTLYRSGDDQRGDDLADISGGKYSGWKDENEGRAYNILGPNSIFGQILQDVDSASNGVVDNAISPQDIYDSIDIASIMAEQGLSADQARQQAYDVIAALDAADFITKDEASYLEGDVDTQFTDVTTGLQAVIETDLALAIAASEASFTSVKDAAADTTSAASALARAASSSSSAAASHQMAAQLWMQVLPFIPPMGGNQEYVDPLAPGANPYGKASGGIVSSSFAMVGELGRELVSLPMGSRVFSASQTEDILSESFKPTVNMMAASVEMPNALQVETDSRASQSSGGDNIVVNFNGDMNIRDQRDIELLVDEIDRELGRRTQNAKRGMAGTARSVSVD